ncbi:hypothetical protein LI82_06985 [Methanococcoides methylutens]|uniref:Uncharacterized protein n=1 Tax=Methanococcoides methylutens TaxID=2226 RepID=A0A099T0D1_METMT|nr:outer membrane lipoprotein-sorting protein [Methanococcoides methylutens]KGK98607.1 hypothetical protein LI82_06985 [Methanococcoides methylutens]
MNTQKLTVILLISFLLLFSAGCIGEELTAEQIAEEYKQKQASVEDYSATINTTAYLGEQEITSISSISQKMPDKMKTTIIKAEQGEGMVMVSNGKTMWTYNPDQNSVMVMEMDPENTFDASQMEYNSLIQDLLDDSDLTFDGMDNVAGRSSYVIFARPNDNTTSTFVVDTKAWIDKETWMPLKFEIYDEEGNLLIVTEYRDFELNTGIPDSEFEFEIPEEAEVINFDETDMVPEEMTLEEAQELSECDILIPSYLPEGYEFESAMVSNQSRYYNGIQEIITILYKKDVPYLTIHETFYDEEPLEPMTTNSEIVDINGHEGHLNFLGHDEYFATLSWNAGKATITITSTLGREETIKVAKSME